MGLGEGEGDAGMRGERGNCDHDGLYERRLHFNKNKKIIISSLHNPRNCSIMIMTSVIFKYPDEGHEEAKKFLQLCTPHGNNKAELCLQKTKDERETWKYLKQESALE